MVTSVTFRDIVCDRQCCPSQLGHNHILLRCWKSLCQCIDLLPQTARLGPNGQFLKASVMILAHVSFSHHESRITNHNSFIASAAARNVCSMSACVCASDINPTSNCDGAK